MRNVPQSRNACEAAAISALFPAVAEPSPPSPPDEHPEDIHNFHVDLAYAHVDEGSDGEPIPDKKEWQEGDHFHGFEFVDYPEAPEGLAWYPGPEHGSYVLKAAESHWTAAELEEELFIADAELEVQLAVEASDTIGDVKDKIKGKDKGKRKASDTIGDVKDKIKAKRNR